MGIQGLLPLLKSIHKPSHLRNYAGQTLGIDAYGWLHRGVIACAVELAQDKPTRKHIDFVMGRVRMLIHFGVKPYMVFDGDRLPSKARTEKDRASRRKECRRLGMEHLRTGRMSMAQMELQKAVDVTPYMARELIEELKKLNVPYIVAPFEADSQLAYLEKKDIISGIISEDSDLLVFGANCLLTKLDQYGECIAIRRDDFTSCRDISLVGWSDKEFRMMAMLSGCDYLAGIERMGLKTAYRLIRKHHTIDKVIRTAQFEGKIKVPPEYMESYTRAERTFLYQWVFCPLSQQLVNLNPLPRGLDIGSLPYLGKAAEAEVAIGVATGELDPSTKAKIVIPSRRFSAAPSTTQTPDEKSGKPITEFFRSQRTPLAELDPNSFSLSPSQQHLLSTQRNVTWSASGLRERRDAIGVSPSHSIPPSSAPQPLRRAVSDFWGPSRSAQSPKRQRLCSDLSTLAAPSPDEGTELGRSRFFAMSASDSPTVRKCGKKKDADGFELWSDDTFAAAEALLKTDQETSQSNDASKRRKRKTLDVFHDSPPSARASPSLEERGEADEKSPPDSAIVSQDSLISTSSTSTVASTSTAATSINSQSTTSTETIFSQGINADFASFKARFSFSSQMERPGVVRAATAPSSVRQALNSSHNDKNIAQMSTKILGKHDSSLSNRTVESVHHRTLLLDSQLSETVGSEDLLVPQSSPLGESDLEEGEDEQEPTDNLDSPSRRTSINFSRFAFIR